MTLCVIGYKILSMFAAEALRKFGSFIAGFERKLDHMQLSQQERIVAQERERRIEELYRELSAVPGDMRRTLAVGIDERATAIEVEIGSLRGSKSASGAESYDFKVGGIDQAFSWNGAMQKFDERYSVPLDLSKAASDVLVRREVLRDLGFPNDTRNFQIPWKIGIFDRYGIYSFAEAPDEPGIYLVRSISSPNDQWTQQIKEKVIAAPNERALEDYIRTN